MTSLSRVRRAVRTLTAPPPVPVVSPDHAQSRMALRAAACALAAAAFVSLSAAVQPPLAAADFDAWWVASYAWTHGMDPYAAVIRQGWRWPHYYPGTMVVAIAPFASLSHVAARILLMTIGAGLFAWAIQRSGRSLWLLASGAFIATLHAGQAGAWLTAAAVLPWLGFVCTCKPTLGLAVSLPYLRRAHVLSAAAFVLLSLLLFPTWPGLWLEAIRVAPDIRSPITRPFGWLVLLALLRWRHRDAWLLLALAAVPHTNLIHETLPLALIPRGTRESQLWAATTLGAVLLGYLEPPNLTWPHILAWHWPLVLGLGYLPALVMLLRRPRLPEPAHDLALPLLTARPR